MPNIGGLVLGALDVAQSFETGMSMIELQAYLAAYIDVAKECRFSLFLQPPHYIAARSPTIISATQALSFQCDAAELPAKTFETFRARNYGPEIQYPYQTTYNDITINFYCVSSMWEKQLFDEWMEMIQPTRGSATIGNWNIAYKDDYIAPIMRIDQFNDLGTPEYSIGFIDAYPISVNEMPVSWASEEILKMSVQFAYTRWTNNPGAEYGNFGTGAPSFSTSSISPFTNTNTATTVGDQVGKTLSPLPQAQIFTSPLGPSVPATTYSPPFTPAPVPDTGTATNTGYWDTFNTNANEQ